MEATGGPQESEDEVAEYAQILRQVADSPRNYPIPRKVGRKQLEQAFLTCFELIGGVPRLALWADRNPDKFYALITKLFPQHMEGKVKHEHSLVELLTEMGKAPPMLEVSDAEVLEEVRRADHNVHTQGQAQTEVSR